MGMFDYIRCEMPLPAGAEAVKEWQTKDLECGMIHYVIRADGRLVDENNRMEPKLGTPEAPEFLTDAYSAWHREWWKHKIGPDIPQDYTGSINFYGNTGARWEGQWWEFCAFLENGICTKILQIEPSVAARTAS